MWWKRAVSCAAVPRRCEGAAGFDLEAMVGFLLRASAGTAAVLRFTVAGVLAVVCRVAALVLMCRGTSTFNCCECDAVCEGCGRGPLLDCAHAVAS